MGTGLLRDDERQRPASDQKLYDICFQSSFHIFLAKFPLPLGDSDESKRQTRRGFCEELN